MRKRANPADAWMPCRVYRGKSGYEFHPQSGGSIKLAPLDAPQSVVWAAYNQAIEESAEKTGTISALIDEFFQSPTFTKLAPGSQEQYKKNSRKLMTVFGKMKPNAIKPEHIRKYMDKRGTTAEVTANRELAFLRRVYSWAYQRGKVSGNPCTGVSRFTERPRDRYITDDEYAAVYQCAHTSLQAIMEISYCCAARVSDVLKISPRQESEKGIYIKQGKTGKAQIKLWSPRLRSAIHKAKLVSGVANMRHTITTASGGSVSYNTFRDWWTDAIKKATAKHPEMNFDFTFHDIKAKAISDFEGDKQKFSGHKTAAQVSVYDRKTPESQTL